MGAKLDSPLSENGRALAKKCGQDLKARLLTPDRIYTSGLIRAKQTAEIITSELGIKNEITEILDFNERDFGDYDGKPYSYILEAGAKYGDNPPSVEPVKSFIARVLAGLNQVREETTGTTLVITHSNPVMVMQAALFSPNMLDAFWKLGDPDYCQGFVYETSTP